MLPTIIAIKTIMVHVKVIRIHFSNYQKAVIDYFKRQKVGNTDKLAHKSTGVYKVRLNDSFPLFISETIFH